jgi:hypothetical protein
MNEIRIGFAKNKNKNWGGYLKVGVFFIKLS